MLMVKAKLLQVTQTVNHQFKFEIDASSLSDFYVEIPTDVTRYLHQLTSDNALAIAKLPDLDFVGVVILTHEIKSSNSSSKLSKVDGTILQVLTDSQSTSILKQLATQQL